MHTYILYQLSPIKCVRSSDQGGPGVEPTYLGELKRRYINLMLTLFRTVTQFATGKLCYCHGKS